MDTRLGIHEGALTPHLGNYRRFFGVLTPIFGNLSWCSTTFAQDIPGIHDSTLDKLPTPITRHFRRLLPSRDTAISRYLCMHQAKPRADDFSLSKDRRFSVTSF